MARTAEKVAGLLEESPEMESAIRVVLERADGGSVEWADVSDELTTGQWSRLIQQGVLEDADGKGFKVADPEVVRDVLDSDEGRAANARARTKSPGESESGSSWSKWDKLAALGAVGLFAGYSLNSVRNLIGSTIDFVLGPLDAALPFYVVVLVLAIFTGLYSTLLQANLMDMDKMGEYQAQMKAIQDRRKAAQERGDDEEMERIQEEQMEAMGDQLGMFKEQFRPMVWIMLLTIPVFLWMYWKILPSGGAISPGESQVTMPLIGQLDPEKGWQTGVIGPLQAWIVWYFLCSMGFTQIIRKALNIQTTPSTTSA
jgi:uncharacterized membrane protein (DUF106 family)